MTIVKKLLKMFFIVANSIIMTYISYMNIFLYSEKSMTMNTNTTNTTNTEIEVLTRKELVELATDLTCAYLGSNQVQMTEVSSIMNSFYQLLSDLNRSSTSIKSRLPVAPAVPIEDSIHENYIVCLEDGKRLQMLKRHLSTVYKMSIEEYKERWGLGADYPVVAPSYAKRRSAIAKNTGLGRSGRKKMQVIDSKVGSAVVA